MTSKASFEANIKQAAIKKDFKLRLKVSTMTMKQDEDEEIESSI